MHLINFFLDIHSNLIRMDIFIKLVLEIQVRMAGNRYTQLRGKGHQVQKFCEIRDQTKKNPVNGNESPDSIDVTSPGYPPTITIPSMKRTRNSSLRHQMNVL